MLDVWSSGNEKCAKNTDTALRDDDDVDHSEDEQLDSDHDSDTGEKDNKSTAPESDLCRPQASLEDCTCTTMCCNEDQHVYQPNESTILSLFTNKGRKFLPAWYSKFPWITLCTTRKKVYCAYCRYAYKHQLFTFCKKGDDAFWDLTSSRKV